MEPDSISDIITRDDTWVGTSKRDEDLEKEELELDDSSNKKSNKSGHNTFKIVLYLEKEEDDT